MDLESHTEVSVVGDGIKTIVYRAGFEIPIRNDYKTDFEGFVKQLLEMGWIKGPKNIAQRDFNISSCIVRRDFNISSCIGFDSEGNAYSEYRADLL